MFIQVIFGRVSDREAAERHHRTWTTELKPGAIGYLGATAGIADDGRFVTMARFESAEAAKQNSDRPEQGRWWAEMEKYLDDVRFTDSTEVELFGGGGSNDAGFVQVMSGRAKDKAKVKAWDTEHEGDLQRIRPDVIGGVAVWDGDRFIQATYFTSETEARAGEKKVSDDPMFAEWQGLVDDMEFIDLRQPILD